MLAVWVTKCHWPSISNAQPIVQCLYSAKAVGRRAAARVRIAKIFEYIMIDGWMTKTFGGKW